MIERIEGLTKEKTKTFFKHHKGFLEAAEMKEAITFVFTDNRNIHDSGYHCFTVIAVDRVEKRYKVIAKNVDSFRIENGFSLEDHEPISIKWLMVSMDCLGNGMFRIWQNEPTKIPKFICSDFKFEVNPCH